MKKIIALLIALFTLVSVEKALADDEGYFILCKPDGAVNVRNRPQKTASVVGWVMFGTYVRTDGKTRNGFVHVIDLAAEVTEGWVYSGYLVYDRPRCEEYTAEVWGGNVMARSCIKGKRLRTLREGQAVTVYARSNAWAVTNKGFVMCDWLKEVSE